MSYGKVYADLTASTQQIEAMHTEAKTSTQQIEALTLKCAQLNKRFEESRKELRKALQDISNEKEKLQKQSSEAKAKAKETKLDYAGLENSNNIMFSWI